MKKYICLIFFFASVFAHALDHGATSDGSSIADAIKSLSTSTSLTDSLVAINKFTSSCQTVSAQLDCAKSAVKGLYEDGLVGDISTAKGVGKAAIGAAKYAVKESVRLQLSS